MPLTDSFGRRINYMRLSVTDRCNLRCRYCMPEEGVPKLKHSDILRFEELVSLAETAVDLGIEKIRLTGGEPLVIRDVLSLITRLSSLRNLRQLVMTTNGVLLSELAAELKRAGVQRLNISLDSLRHDTFVYITRCGDLDRVLAGIRAAEDAGFPIKINMVVMRGINDDEIRDFARLTLSKPYAVRFIEYMPTVKEENWRSLVVAGDEIVERIARHYSLAPVEREKLSGPSQDFQIPGAAGTVGVVTPVSRPFCVDCNRIRVTASGMARGCLFDTRDYDLKTILRSGDKEALVRHLEEIVRNKPETHAFPDNDTNDGTVAMSKIGG